jgi:hypothetical protein
MCDECGDVKPRDLFIVLRRHPPPQDLYQWRAGLSESRLLLAESRRLGAGGKSDDVVASFVAVVVREGLPPVTVTMTSVVVAVLLSFCNIRGLQVPEQ